MLATSATAFQQDLAATTWRLAASLPVRTSAAIDRSIYQIAASNLLGQVVPLGCPAPLFALPAADGRPTSLRALLPQGPVVLTFFRGHWCPYCAVQLQAYQQLLPELWNV